MKTIVIRESDKPNELPMLPLLVTKSGSEFGSFNLYGDVYRDVYSYSSLIPNMIADYGIYPIFEDNEPVVGNFIEYNYPHSLININQLLCNLGHIRLKNTSNNYLVVIDWANTLVWSDSSDWAMINLNIKGRQQCGTICPTNYHETRELIINAIRKELECLHIACTFYKPDEQWDCKGVPPDILLRCNGYIFSDLVNVDDVVEEW